MLKLYISFSSTKVSRNIIYLTNYSFYTIAIYLTFSTIVNLTSLPPYLVFQDIVRALMIFSMRCRISVYFTGEMFPVETRN